MEGMVVKDSESASSPSHTNKGKGQEETSTGLEAQPTSSPPHVPGEGWYLHHLNRHTEYLHNHRHGAVNEGGIHLNDRKDGESQINLAVLPSNSTWTVEEKEIFFGSLARHSRLRPDLIAAEVRTKTEAQVMWYLETLRAMSLSLRHDHLPSHNRRHLRPWLDGIAPPAREVSEHFIAREEELAKRIIDKEIEWSRQATEAARIAQTKEALDRQKGAWRIKKRKIRELEGAVSTPVLKEELKKQKQAILDLERTWFIDDFLSNINAEKMKFMARRFDELQKDEVRQQASQAVADARARLRAAAHMTTTQSSQGALADGHEGAGSPSSAQAGPFPTTLPGSTQCTTAEVWDEEMLVAYEEWRLTVSSLRPSQQNQLVLEWHEEQRLTWLSKKERWLYTPEERAEYDILSEVIPRRTQSRSRQATAKGIDFGETATGSQLKLLLLLHRRERKAQKEAEGIPVNPPRHTQARRPGPIVKAIRAVNEEALDAIAEHREAWKDEISRADKIIAEWAPGNMITGADVFKQYREAADRAVTMGIDIFHPAIIIRLIAKSDTDTKCLDANVLRWLREELKLYIKGTMLRAISLKEQDLLRRPDTGAVGAPPDEIQSSHIWRACGITHHSIPAEEAAAAYAVPDPALQTGADETPIGLGAWLAHPEAMDSTGWTPYRLTNQQLHSDLLEHAVHDHILDPILPEGMHSNELAEESEDYIADEDWQDEKDLVELDDLQDVIDETEDKEYEHALCASLVKDEFADDTPIMTFDWTIFDRVKRSLTDSSSRATTTDLDEEETKYDEGYKSSYRSDDDKTDDEDNTVDDDKTADDTGSDNANDNEAGQNDVDGGPGNVGREVANSQWLLETKREYITKLYKFSRRRWRRDLSGKGKRYRKPAHMREPRVFRSAAMVPSDDDEDLEPDCDVAESGSEETGDGMDDTNSEG